MTRKRKKLARLIWRLWKRRNYYKLWYEYEKDSNNIWKQHFVDKEKDNGSV